MPEGLCPHCKEKCKLLSFKEGEQGAYSASAQAIKALADIPGSVPESLEVMECNSRDLHIKFRAKLFEVADDFGCPNKLEFI